MGSTTTEANHEGPRDGLKCSPEKRAYQAERRRHLHYLYFKTPEERAAFAEMAGLENYGHDFNGWLLLKLHAAVSGTVYDAEYVEGLKKDKEKYQKWLESAEARNESYRKEVETLRAQKDALLQALLDAPDGAEVVKAFLGASG